MASAVYPKYLITSMSGGINLAALDVKAILLDLAVYTYNAAHQFYSDLSGIVATKTGALGSKTIGVVGTGVFDAADGTVTAATGTHAEAIATFIDRGGAATADDLCSFNELSAPVTPNGGNITIQFNAAGIFSQ